MFEKCRDDDGYFYYDCKERLKTGQTLSMKFWYYEYENLYTVEMEIFSKRKRKSSSFLDVTGRGGIEGLILAKMLLECFIEYLAEITPVGKSKKIVIGASNSRRMKIYKHYLGKIGFVYTRTPFNDMGMVIEVRGKNG